MQGSRLANCEAIERTLMGAEDARGKLCNRLQAELEMAERYGMQDEESQCLLTTLGNI
jgi:uncharacterized Ntn-hydrolase superfamily protein